MGQAYGKQFSYVYNLLWGNFARQIAPKILDYYENTSVEKSNKSMLDLCCGAGHLSAIFLAHGYSVTGIDLSADILVYARHNAGDYLAQGKAVFIQGDAADFTIEQNVPLAVSTFDALNHLPDLTSLQNCFRSVYAAVNPKGIFIFDLNTRAGLKKRWNSLNIEDDETLTLITRSIFVEENDRAWTHITGFIRNTDGKYDRFEERIFNTAFNLEEVKNLLIGAGWRKVSLVSESNFYIPLDEPENYPRVFFIAEK